MNIRIGQGVDVHAFGPGDKIVLGGTVIPHSHGLIAHSDGDVLLHALCDALLGAAALGDIGRHFPDTDPGYANADSRGLTRLVMAKLRHLGWRVVNLDATLIAERPRMAPYTPAMRANLAAASAWSPNPQNPPLYLDLPTGDDAQRQAVLARFAANAPLAFVHQYIGELRRYDAIAIDVGDQDGLRGDSRRLHEILNSFGVENSFEEYVGNHTNRLAFRFQEQVLPFFGQHLCRSGGCQ